MELMLDGNPVYSREGTSATEESTAGGHAPFVWAMTNDTVTGTTETVTLNPLTGTNVEQMGNSDVVQGIVTSLNAEESWKTTSYLMMFTLDAGFSSNRIIHIISKMPLSTGVIPRGMIMAWAGTPDNIPDGWALCDGQDGTPDLNDKFILGTSDAEKVGASGGEKEHTLELYEMPAHSHGETGTVLKNNYGSSPMSITTTTGSDYSVLSGESTRGQGSPHNNMPPYYTLCYIMKT